MNKVIALSVVAVLTMAGTSYAAEDILAAKKAALDNSEWSLELKSMAGVKGKSKAEQDTLLFRTAKFLQPTSRRPVTTRPIIP